MKIKLLTLSLLLFSLFFFASCQNQDTSDSLNEALVPILETGYYMPMPAGYQFPPEGGGITNDSMFLISIRSPATHPSIWIFPADFIPSPFLIRGSPTKAPEDFGEQYLPPEKIASDPFEIYLAKYAFDEGHERQKLAQGIAFDEEGDGFFIDVLGDFSQQEEGYQLLKEILQSVVYVAPTATEEP